MGRAERRAQERKQAAERFGDLSTVEQEYAKRLSSGKLTPAEFKKACQGEFHRGYSLAAKEVVAQCYAAAAIAVKRHFNVPAEQVTDFLVTLDEVVMNGVDSKDAIDQAFHEAGVQLDFVDPFMTVKKVN